jgi:hypothetical protein
MDKRKEKFEDFLNSFEMQVGPMDLSQQQRAIEIIFGIMANEIIKLEEEIEKLRTNFPK